MSFKAALLAGGKGGAGSFRNRPDNLRSTDTFEVLIGLGSGRIRLAPGGLQNLYVDDVPVEDGQGKATFKSFAASLFDGDPLVLQPVKLQLGASSGMSSVGLDLANNYDNAPGDWKFAAVTHPGVEFIDLRFVVQQLYSQTKKGTGDATATIEIELRPSGSANWINPLLDTTISNYNVNGFQQANGLFAYIIQAMLDETRTRFREEVPGKFQIKGKTNSPYIKEVRIAVPSEGAYANKTWEIRCRLIEKDYIVSGDDGENEVRRTITWESVSGASSDPIGNDEAWRGVSYVQIFGTATDQINGIPEITGVYDLDLYKVPPSSVWDPVTRQYTGVAWDGITTELKWTQCPAWQIKGLVEDDLSGISALAPGSTMNKWDVLEASKWFAQQVPDGRGGFHPRYSANWFLEQGLQVSELVNYLAGAVGGFAWDEGDGKWRLKVEKPETPSMIFTKENIVGEFVYQHTDIDTRYNDITAVYRDRDQRYIENRVRVFDQESIDTTGRRHTSIALVGCDNRQEALRRAYIRLLTAQKEVRNVTFLTNRAGATLEPLSVIGVADGDLNSDSQMRSTGRIVSTNGDKTMASVRDTLRLEVGVSYKLHVTVPNLAYDPDTTVQPSNPDWRKPTITLTRNIVNTAGQRGDVKDLYLDQALPANLPEFATVALEAVGLPALPKQYRVLSVTPNDDGETVSISAIEIYTAKWAESDSITEEQLAAQVSTRVCPSPLLPAAGLFHVETYSTGVTTRRVLSVSWDRPASRYIDGYRVEYRVNGGGWITLTPKTTDTLVEIADPPPGVYDVRITTLDRRGGESIPLNGNITLDDSATIAPSGNLTREVFAIQVEADGTGGDFSQASGTFVVYGGAGNMPATELSFEVVPPTPWITINANGVYTVTDPGVEQAQALLRATILTSGTTLDKMVTVIKTRAGVDATLENNVAPDPITGLGLSSTVETGPDGMPWIKLLATWQPSSAPDLSGYTLAIKEGIGGSFVEFNCGPLINSFFWRVQPDTQYEVKIRAYDTAGLTSAFSASLTHLTSHDITPPSAPTSLQASSAFQTVFLSWINPTAADLTHVEVYENTTNASGSAIRLDTLAARPGTEGTYTRSSLAPDSTRFYWVRAVDKSGNRSAFSLVVQATTQKVFTQDLSGTLDDAFIQSVSASKITGQLNDSQIAAVNAAKLAGTITASQLADGSVSGTKFASGLKPIEVVAALPANGNTVGRTVMLTTDGKIYRYTSTGWSASVAASDLTGQIGSTQISDSAVTSNKIAANTITAGNIAANTITGGQIAADAISAGHILAGAITASEIAVDAVTAAHIAAGTITAAEIAANTITGSQIAADTITSGNIAANAITTAELAAGSVQAANIAAGQINAGHIVAGSITGDRIAANAISAAHIVAGSITGDRIAAGQITADKLNVTSLSAISANIGLLRTASSGARTEIEANQIRVYDSNNVMRVRMGIW